MTAVPAKPEPHGPKPRPSQAGGHFGPDLPPEKQHGIPRSILRWNLHHRLQHGFLALSMIGLLGTGLPIKYAHTEWAPGAFTLLGGFRTTLMLHKASAVVLCAVGVWHLLFLAWGRRRYGLSLAMLPGPEDTKDAVRHAAFLLGLRASPPRYGRYTYLEKFEYLAIFWGMVVMGLSGFALWFPVTFGAVVPRWGLDMLRIVHSNEAFVALISLAFGHFFFAHFSPQVFPSSSVWYSGRISLAHMQEEHPLELEHLVAQGKLPPTVLHSGTGHPVIRLSGWRRAVGALELLLYSLVFYWLLVTFIPLMVE